MKTQKILILLFSLSLIFYSCKKDTGSPSTNTKDPGDSTSIATDTTQPLMLQLVNAARAKGCTCGTTVMPPVKPLTWNTILAQVALAHSVDMDENNYFSHTGLDGSSPGDRITAAGYIWNSYGENIAEGFSDEQSVMNAWLQSEGHCLNIMNAGFKEMGSGKDGTYWTQDFGSR
ncbi:MAG TPA: CAP domain-containing protein [Puia sp.]|jgi:uncharacterized protein YkwD|nr:CAP domain-containing protein [Puia sp.]